MNLLYWKADDEAGRLYRIEAAPIQELETMYHTTRDKLVPLDVRLPEAVIARLEATAYREGVRLSDMIQTIIETGLDTHNGQEIRRAA